MKNPIRMWIRGVLWSAVLVLPAGALAVFGLGGSVLGVEIVKLAHPKFRDSLMEEARKMCLA
jgi:hypothetical protein